ncbi:hypothetical protein ACI2VH_02640 [Ralstonia nicotianae]
MTYETGGVLMSADIPNQIIRPAAGAPPVGNFPNSVFSLGATAVARDDGDDDSTAAVTPAPAPVPRRASQQPRVSRAIEYLRTHGPCSSVALLRAMGFADDVNPRPYLKGPLDDGRIVCVDGMWSLGPALKPQAVTVAAPSAAPVPAVVPAPLPDNSVAQAQVGGVSLALYADGAASITENGITMHLSAFSMRFLRTFESMAREFTAEGGSQC